jgi:hypothetical protein
MKRRVAPIFFAVFATVCCVAVITAFQQGTARAANHATTNAATDPANAATQKVRANSPIAPAFDPLADSALQAMRQRATELGIGGVAVVAYFEGDIVKSWTSKMIVVGRMKDEPSATDKGANLLGIAYAKAAEMADTLKNSGSQVRPPMTGEYGWTGGVIARGKNGYLIAAFSGGKSDDDVKVSTAGVEQLKTGL